MGYQNFFATKLAVDIGTSDTVITLETVPSVTSGRLVLEARNSTQREVIKYTGVAGSTITGVLRGQGGTSAKTHTKNSLVEMNATSEDLQDLYDAFASFSAANNDWRSLAAAPSSVTALGNRSYSVVVPGNLTATTCVGMKLKLPRSVSAPTQCASFNGTTQYYNKTTGITGLSMTDDFAAGGWVKIDQYKGHTVVSRRDATQGWSLEILSDGRIQLAGFAGGLTNYRRVLSAQSLPINKWVHIAAQLDMNVGTLTTTTNYVMIDGVDVPATYNGGGTAPTALVVAGNLEVGSASGGSGLFSGKMAQIFVYNVKVTQANVLASMHQGMTGSESGLGCLYSFNNSINDLSPNNNHLSANGGIVATNADTPFTNPVTGTNITAGTANYGVIMSQSFSTNTTYIVQIPEGETLPTTGGIGTLQYASTQAPYGFPAAESKWDVEALFMSDSASLGSLLSGIWVNSGRTISVPAGKWTWDSRIGAQVGAAGSTILVANAALSTSTSTPSNPLFTGQANKANAVADAGGFAQIREGIEVAAATIYYILIGNMGSNANSSYQLGATVNPTVVRLKNAYI